MAAKPVVVGVDGSDESLLAAEWSIQQVLLDHARGPVAVVPSGD
jgi:hypothetical protein